MSDLRELYQEMILEHARRPRNRRALDVAGSRKAEGFNPLCGDRIDVYVKLAGGVVEDVSFEGSGCAISTASASMMTQSVRGKTVAEAEALFERFHALVTEQAPKGACGADFGKLAVFAGVSEFPARVKCATLAWHTLRAALQAQEGVVTTEEDEPAASLAPGPPQAAPADSHDVLGTEARETIRSQVVDVLRNVYDPEIPVSIWELGLIYDLVVEPAGLVRISMTLTSPACPVAESLPPEVEARVGAIAGVTSVRLDVVWEPPWNPEMMTPQAKLLLDMF